MNKYLIYTGTKKTENNGGPKMVWDMVNTVNKMGYIPLPIYEVEGLNTTKKNFVDGIVHIMALLVKVHKGDIVLIQFPLNRELMYLLYFVLYLKRAHVITMIHDVDYLRRIPLRNHGVEGMKKIELSLLAKTEYLICPNKAMIKELKTEQLKVKFVSQEISDYMYDGESCKTEEGYTVIIAGNLSPVKASYIYKMPVNNYRLALYGDNIGRISNANICYCGSYNPNELIPNMKGDYGLVWDGPDIDGCQGNYGNYQRFNNPHKLSLYIAAGIPVIIWKQAALYEFVKNNGVGFGVESLAEIDEKITRYSPEQFRENVLKIQKMVSKGAFLEKALLKIEMDIFESQGD